MDPLQLILVVLVLLLTGFLSIMGIQVFFILRDLRKELNKVDKLLSLIESHGLSLPQHTNVNNMIAQASNQIVTKPKEVKEHRRLFRRG